MKTKKAPDPKRQLQGKIAKAQGAQFEAQLQASFDWYAAQGLAAVEKNQEPLRVARNLGNGKFLAFYEKKAQPDYKGTVRGGRTVNLEAKSTATDRVTQNRVTEGQWDYLQDQQRLGALCYVIIGFSSGTVYRLPWSDWVNMKKLFGRKYVKEEDVQKYRVPEGPQGVLLLLHKNERRKHHERNQ